jgi:lipopolysaccharide export system protein LptA
MEAPQCVYDSAQRQASSPGQLQVQTGDGRLSVEGEGFLWTQSDSHLIISNQVRALIQRAGTNPPAAVVRPPLQITSQSFEFDATNRHVIFREHVAGNSPEMEFVCGLLTVSGTTNNESYDVIVADKDVSIVSKLDGRSAKAERAISARVGDRIDLSGHTTWKQGRQEGSADRAVIVRANQSFDADGNVVLRLPRESLQVGGFFLSTTNAPLSADESDSPLVDLFANHFQSRSNLTIAEGAVRVIDTTNRLACGKLNVQSATTIAPDATAVAEQNVVVERGDGRIQADRAVYTKSDAKVVFTGSPKWNLDQIEGRAERVTIRSDRRETHAEGNVDVKVPLGGQGASLLPFFPGTERNNSAAQTGEVFAREFTAKERLVIFQGDVRARQLPITGSEPRLRSDALEVQLAADRRHAESVVASNHVFFEQGSPGVTNGPAAYRTLAARSLTTQPSPQPGQSADLVADGEVQYDEPGAVARGDHATYNAATDIMNLTGQPYLETPQLITTSASVLSWHRAKNHVSATGSYKIQLRSNIVELDDRKLRH